MEHIKRKRVIIIVYLLIALLISGAIIIMSYVISEVQSDYDEGISQLDSLLKTYNKEVAKYDDATSASYNEILTTVELTASALNSSDHELSPSAFDSGFIVLRTADGSGRPKGFPKIEYDDDWLFSDRDTGAIWVDDNTTALFSRIVDDYYYVEFIDDSTGFKALEKVDQTVDPQHMLADLAEANNCDFLILSPDSIDSDPDEIPVISATGVFKDYKNTKEFDLSAEEISKSAGESFTVAILNGKPYLIQSLNGQGYIEDYTITAVMLVNAFLVFKEAWEQTLSAIVIMMLICIALAVWILSTFRMVKTKALTYEQMERYAPASIKRKAIVFVLAGFLLVHFAAVFNQHLESMFLESKHANRTLTSYFHRLSDDTTNTEKLKKLSRKQIYTNSQRIADLLEDMSELQNPVWLDEASEIIGADYIILYDHNGDEVVTNARYKGMSLGKKESSATYDFRRLLRGVRYIYHDNIKDEVTGLTRNLHGISVDLNSDETSYGAMLIAFEPNEYADMTITDYDAAASAMATPGTILFGADPKTGEILYSSKKSFIGKNADDLCTESFPMRSNYLGFLDINGKEYYGRSASYEGNIYYYFVEKSKMNEYSGIYASTCRIMFLIISVIMLLFLFHGFTEDKFKEYAVVEDPDDDELLRRFEKRYLKKQHKASADLFSVFNKDLTPGYKAISAAGFLLFIYIVLTMLSIYNARYTSDSNSNLINYISRGDWERGFNTFAGAAILFLICALAVTLFIFRLISIAMVSLLSERSETICLLIMNILSYAVMIASVFIALGYLGVNARAIIASAGLVGLALSLGAKDLVADVLAGITTIAEGTYQVGEVIEIAGFRGEVAKLGMRSTTLVGRGKNIKTFRNSSIGDVINYSRMNSWYPLTLTFSNAVSISEVEKFLDEELPAVGAKYPEIISGPEYRGIDSVSSDKTTILILTECKQTDYNSVQLNVNREVLHIMKSHNIATQ